MLRVRNFEKFQHYKHRSPPWIKLHRGVLHDYAFTRLQDASKAHAILLWLLASTCDNEIPDDAEWIARQIHSTSEVNVEELLSAGFLERYDARKRKRDASKTPAKRKQNADSEGEESRDREDIGAGSQNSREPGPSRVTWLTPIGLAYEQVYGAGSFPYKQAASEFAPLHKHHTSEEIARRLAWYLANKGSEQVLTADKLKARNFTPSLKDFRLRFGAFDPSAEGDFA